MARNGFAFSSCNVNYSGSSGYGRAYRERLRGNWGIVDVKDCATAVRLLGERGLIDPKRVAIRGGSSGGYTVLQALVNYPDTWAAGTSLYGISDLAALAGETHKFERCVCVVLASVIRPLTSCWVLPSVNTCSSSSEGL